MLALVAAACSGSRRSAEPSTAKRTAPSRTVPPTNPSIPAPVTTVTTPSLLHQAQGSPLPLSTDGGDFSVTVARLGALVKPHGNPNYWLGAVVTVSDVTGTPDFDPAQFGLTPVTDGASADGGEQDDDATSTAINRSACGSIRMLADVLDQSDASQSDSGLGYTLSDGMSAVTGCVTFTFDAPDKPNTIAFYDDEPEDNSGAIILGSWSVRVPSTGSREVRQPSAPKVTYRVTGNGSRSSSITYTEGSDSSIEQSTNARLPWTKKVSTDADFYSVSAQDDDGTRITCEIIDSDGSVLSKHTAHGQYAIADCQSSS